MGDSTDFPLYSTTFEHGSAFIWPLKIHMKEFNQMNIFVVKDGSRIYQIWD